jgi:putative heme-binding domain-containing protein
MIHRRGRRVLGLLAVAGVGWGAPDAERGQRLFGGNCAPCHGPRGDGGKGADLTHSRYRRAPDDEALIRVIRFGIPGAEMPGTRHLSDEDIRDVMAYLRTLRREAPPVPPGDAASGEQVYAGKGACARCHTLRGRGGATGPDLTGIGERRSAAFLRESLVNPEAYVPDNYIVYRWFSVIPDNFVQVQITTKDGRRITGVRLNEDPFSIQIRDLSDRLHSFWKEELAEVRKEWGKSPMPSYRDLLTARELDDLVAYLASLRGEP